MGLDVRFQPRDLAGEFGWLAENRLDVRCGDNPARFGRLGLAQPAGGLGIIAPSNRDLRQANAGCGQVRGSPHRLKISFFSFFQVAGSEQSVADDQKLSGACGISVLRPGPADIRRQAAVENPGQW